VEIKLNKYQDDFIFSGARFPALVAAVGTGKTLGGIGRMMDQMESVPNNLGIVVRREFTDLKDSTIKDFELYTGLTVGSDKNCTLPNGSLIMFRHGDEINVLKNINAGAILMEQAEEFETDEAFTFLRDRLRRREAALRTLFLIANTNGHNWIYKQWKVNRGKDPEFELYEATTFDNAHNLPSDYIADLKKMEKTHPEHFRRYVMNSWEDVDTIDVIIRPEWVRACGKTINIKPLRKVISIDVARYGDDSTTYYAIENTGDRYRITNKWERSKESTMETVGWAVKYGREVGIDSYAVDEIGVGAGVFDRLDELEKEVFAINSSEKSSDPLKYYNRRTEIYANAAEVFREGRVEVLSGDDVGNEQLAWARYKAIKSTGLLQVEAKEDIKKRYKRSPDNADAIVAGIWAVTQVKESRVEKYKEGKTSQYEYNPETC
jgi:hypothetical protein